MSVYVEKILKQAKESTYKLANLTTAQKNKILKNMAQAIVNNKKLILAENKKDIAIAKRNKLKQSFIERLTLNDKRIKEMSVSLKEIANLKDPVGEIISTKVRPNLIKVQRIRVPIGVVLIVYEARPNVTSDCIGLLFKTSNIGVLRGGSSALYSNKIIAKILDGVLKKNKINFKAFFVIEKTDRKTVDVLLTQEEYIDLVIPRGGESLIRKVAKTSTIPVIKHYKGVCHIFIDKEVDSKKALKICVNAKTQRPSVCNAVETILVHRGSAKTFLPLLKKEFDSLGVKIKADRETSKIISRTERVTDKDWSTEYLDLTVSIKVVKDLSEAIKHINTYGSHHTDSILTKSKKNAGEFLKALDSACCFVNISTRFSDGHQFGLGAEIGISTDKLHARGPMGLEELTTYKYIVTGNGQIRE